MMLLPDGPYRIVRLTLDLGAGGRQGLAVLMVRLPPPRVPAPTEERPPATVAGQVLLSQAPLTAVLYRLRLPLEEAEALQIGQVLPLAGVTVASVRVEAGGQDLGPARLGQVAGMRAIRIEQPVAPSLGAIPSPAKPAGPP
jgi:flagellar motor switch protein FliM